MAAFKLHSVLSRCRMKLKYGGSSRSGITGVMTWQQALKRPLPPPLIPAASKMYYHLHSDAFNYNYYNCNSISQAMAMRPPSEALSRGVRFFAAPAQLQTKKKGEVKDSKGHRLNEQIKADFIRLVTDQGHDVFSRHEALQRAKALNLDLVEVDRTAVPPVCKLMDYHKERYKQQVKEKERAKVKAEGSMKKGGCKEVRFSAKTELKDLKMKADTVKRLMEHGYRVKCMAMGTEDQDLGRLVAQLSSMIEDVAIVESGPRVERRQAYIIVRHVKFGPSKKGSKKGSNSDATTNSEAAPTSQSSIDLEEETYSEESGVANEVNALLQGEGKATWSVSNANKDLNKMFDLDCEVKGTNTYAEKQVKYGINAASPATKDDASGFPSSRVPDFTSPNARPPPHQETENRYAKSTTHNASAGRNAPRFPAHGNQPQPRFNTHPSGGPTQAGKQPFPPRNFQFPQKEFSQGRGENANKSKQFEPRGNTSGPVGRCEPSGNGGSHASKSTGYGIFGVPKTDASGKQGSGVEASQEGGGTPNAARSSALKSDSNNGLGADDSGKWGIFGRGSSN